MTVVRGDVTSPSDLEAAARGCDVVFHCAYGTSGSQKHRAWVNTEGTRRVLAAAQEAKVRRIVYLSTLMVYGQTGDGDLDETAPRSASAIAYSDSKLEAERIALSSGLPVAVLQPTAVYGPWGGVWTETVLESLTDRPADPDQRRRGYGEPCLCGRPRERHAARGGQG